MNSAQFVPVFASKTLATSIVVSVSLVAFHLIKTYWNLRQFPGPFWARITNLQRVFWVQTARSHEIHADVHARYGDYVRMGPNMVSIANPDAIPSVYPIRPGVPKVNAPLGVNGVQDTDNSQGNFYRSLMPYSRQGSSLPLVFNTRDENLHMHLKKPIAPIFSLSNVLTFERFVDHVLGLLFTQFDARFIQQRATLDLGNWLQFFAFEVMGSMTFSRQYGFIEQGHDGKGLLTAIWNFMKTAAPVSMLAHLRIKANY